MSSPMDAVMAAVKWEVVPRDESRPASDLPHATHSGVLDLFGVQLRCYRLNTGEAVFDASDVEKFFMGLH